MTALHDEDPDILSVATSIAEGTDVDWASAERTTTDARLLDQLKVIDSLSRFTDKVPDTWWRLSIAEELGRGSHGTVYRAHDPHLDLDIALKVVRPHGPGAQVIGATALNEARLLAQVNHPNVVRVFWAEIVGEEVGVAMELIKGRSLRERLRQQGPMGAREATLVGIDIARALAAVHRARLVHADIKAGNVMEAPNGRTVLMDFGVGCDQKARKRTGSGRAGTPLYQAPELFHDAEASPQTDIYSLGVLLFHLCTGSYPIDAQDAIEVERHHLDRRPVRLLRDVRPDLPPSFVRVVDRALADAPEHRFHTAGELEAALDASLDHKPPVVQGWPTILAVAASVVLAVALLGIWIGRSPAIPATAGTHAPVTGTPDAVPAPPILDYMIEAAFYRHESGRDIRLAEGERLRKGDALSLQVQSSVPVFAYVVNEDDKGESFLLFPLPNQQLSNPLGPGTSHQIPGLVNGESVRWEVSSAGGREHFLVFVSPEPPAAEFQQMIAALPRASFGAPQMAQRLGNELVGALRGVGGLIKSPSAPRRGRLSDEYKDPLPAGEQSARGWWIRRLTLVNPDL